MKFDDNSRRRVIRELQRSYGVELSRIGHPWKYLRDNNGARYLLLGGIDYCQAIPGEIFDAEEHAAGNCTLVVAIQERDSLDIFAGPFRPMLEHRSQLSVDKDQYVFHLHRFTTGLVVREIPTLELRQINQKTPEERSRTLREAQKKLKRAQAIAIAKARRPNAAREATTRGGRGIVAVDGNLIRADFRKGKSR